MLYNKTREEIELNFCRGKDLSIVWPQLTMKQSVMVAGICFENIYDLKSQNIKAIIVGADAWQEVALKQKNSFVKKNKND